jgi:cell division protein FtsA
MKALKTNKKALALEQGEVHEEEKVLVEHDHVEGKVNVSSHAERKSIFDKWSEKLKDFLDNAE